MTERPIALLGASSGKIPGKNGARRTWKVMVQGIGAPGWLEMVCPEFGHLQPVSIFSVFR
jgi:hypothetical protein